MRKVVVTYGSISGIIVIVIMFLGMSLSSSANLSIGTSELIGYAGMIIALSLIYFAIKNYRDQHLEGTITFGKAFKIGLFISLIVTAFYVTAWMAYSATEDGKEVIEVYKEQYAKNLEESDLSQEQKEEELKIMKEQMDLYENSTIVKILFTCIEILPVALLISIICALILRKKEKDLQMS